MSHVLEHTVFALIYPSEIIQDLENMMHSHLNRFQKSMKTLPQKIIMFRVSLLQIRPP